MTWRRASAGAPSVAWPQRQRTGELMATVGQLWRAVFPQARPWRSAARRQRDDAALARSVAWIRVVKPRTPAFDALEPDDLAICSATTLANLRALAVEPASLGDALAGAGASGLLVVGEPAQADGGVDEALDRVIRLGLAGFSMVAGDVAALERSAIGYVVNGRAELEQRAAALEAQLEQAALAGAGVEGLAATIARFLSRPVAIEGRDGAPLAVHAPLETPQDAPQLTEYLRRRRGAALRVPLPAPALPGHASRHAADRGPRTPRSGALVLLGGGPPTELERVAAARISGFLALLLARAGDASSAALERAAGGLPGDGPPWVVILARQVDERSPTTIEERERLRAELRSSESQQRLALRGDATSLELRIVGAPGLADPAGLELAARISRQLRRPVALSRPFDEPAQRSLVEAQARVTLETVEALPAAERSALSASDGTLVARADSLAAYRLLAALPALPDAARQARALLAPLLTGNARRDRETLATLRAVLDHAGLAEAAAALGVHRNTLTYRLARIEQRSGWRLSDPLIRFAVALAVRLVQNAQDEPRESAAAGVPQAAASA